MKLWTLMENTSCREDILCQHGLSLYIEAGGRKILFDTGQTDAFAENAEKMGVNLSQVDFAVLSHGHYDHGGGLRKFLEINQKAPIYVNQFAFQPHYHGPEKYIGLDPKLQENSRILLTGDETQIAPGMRLVTCSGKPAPFPSFGKDLSVLEDGKLVQDDFRHEQYLVLEEKGKRIVFSGCSHRGVENIVSWLRPDVLIGGFHFSKLDPDGQDRELLEAAARRLLAFPTVYYTCHCTGVPQYEFLKKRMGDRLHYLSAGSTL